MECQAFEVIKDIRTDIRVLAKVVGDQSQQLAVYNSQLQEHMKRSDLLEEQNSLIRKDHNILAKNVLVLQQRVGIIWITPKKVFLAIIAIATGVPGFIALISWLKDHIVFK